MIRYRIRKTGRGSRFSLFTTGKYRLIYKKGEITVAPEGTLGIFCFKTREDAERFKNWSPCGKYWEIYRVKGIGRGKIPTKICTWFYDEFKFDKFYELGEYSTIYVPPGIILYTQVKVLN